MNDEPRPTLGRGLDALLGSLPASVGAVMPPADAVSKLPIEKLIPGPYQPRREIDDAAIQELSDSIRAHGIIQPIVVRPAEASGTYEIIAGERRWRAAQRAALHEVPALVKTVSDQNAMAIALIENIQRENLNPIEEADLLKRLADEFFLSHQDIADSVGKSRATVTNLLRLLTLAEPVLDLVRQREIDVGHAKVLLALEGEDQIKAAMQVVQGGLNVRKTETLVKNWHKNKDEKKPRTDPDITRLALQLSEAMDAKVSISDTNGRGFIKISYNNLDQFDGILSRINVNRT